MDDRKIVMSKNKKTNIEDLKIEFTQIPEEDMPGGDDLPRCVGAVNSIGYFKLLSILNLDDAKWWIVENMDEHIDYEIGRFDFGRPGIYQFDFNIIGEKDYWGEYESWSDITNIQNYKIKIKDKTEIKNNKENLKKYNWEETLIFDKCLFALDYSGEPFLLDIIDVEDNYVEVIDELYNQLSEIQTEKIKLDFKDENVMLFEATITIPPKNGEITLNNIKIIKTKLDKKGIK